MLPGDRPGSHIIENPNNNLILTPIFHHKKIGIDPNYSYGKERKYDQSYDCNTNCMLPWFVNVVIHFEFRTGSITLLKRGR